jgi:hypothetical protein
LERNVSIEEAFNPQGMAEQPQVTEPEAPEAPAVDEGDGAPAAPQAHESHVPLAALEAERRGRQDWKEKAIRAEERLRELESRQQPQQHQHQPQQQAPQFDPILNTRLDFSEVLLRQSLNNAPDIDEKIDAFKAAAAADPSLYAAMMRSQHPWKFAYDKANEMAMLKEIGSDPVAYRAKLEAEIRAKLQSEAPAQPQFNVPATLNGARSVAPRSASTWTGPPPLESIFG